MKVKVLAVVTAVSVMAIAVGYAMLPSIGSFGARAAFDAPVSSPPGITMQPLGRSQGYDLGKNTASAIARDQIAYTDIRGLTLYTFAEDPEGKSTCTGDCATLFPPYLAPEDAEVFGPWSIIARDDGQKQWALNGKPLYRYSKDVDPGSVGGDSPANYGAKRINGVGQVVGGGIRGSLRRDRADIAPLPEGWKPALAYPIEMALPPGITVKELPDATVFSLVDVRNHTIYAAPLRAAKSIERCRTDECKQWQPVRAPVLAGPVGEFTVHEREDGVSQWVFRGLALYTFAGDLAPGFSNGTGVDERLQVVAVMRYFMPDGVTVQNTVAQGRVLATEEGKTLYRRDGYILQSGGGHSLRRGQPPRPAVGRDIGIDARCVVDCDKWKPFLASADAKPSGFWDVATRPDGSKQWVYQGYALWTYDGDQQPGDINGHDHYDMFVYDDPQKVVDVGTPMDGAAGLWWSIAIP